MYRESCAPVAIAALLGAPVADIADRLFAAGAARDRAPAGGSSDFGTDVEIAADLLLRMGHRIQLWNPDGSLFLSAPELTRYLARRAQIRATTLMRRPVECRTPRVVRLPNDPEPESEAPILTLRAWRSRFPLGRWLVVVATDEGSHALALSDGEIVAGGEVAFLDHEVLVAYRIHQEKAA